MRLFRNKAQQQNNPITSFGNLPLQAKEWTWAKCKLITMH